MKTLAFASLMDAETRSREEWSKILGRPRRQGDVTEFLWAVEPTEAGAALKVPDDEAPRLTKAELGRLVAVIDERMAEETKPAL